MEELTLAESAAEAAPSAELEIQDEAARASRLMRTLKPEQQQVIRLSVYHGHTHQSIAEATGMPLGTVKTHLRRGLLRLREAMRPSSGAAGAPGGEALR